MKLCIQLFVHYINVPTIEILNIQVHLVILLLRSISIHRADVFCVLPHVYYTQCKII